MLSGIKVAVLGPPGKHLALLRGHTYWGGGFMFPCSLSFSRVPRHLLFPFLA